MEAMTAITPDNLRASGWVEQMPGNFTKVGSRIKVWIGSTGEYIVERGTWMVALVLSVEDMTYLIEIGA